MIKWFKRDKGDKTDETKSPHRSHDGENIACETPSNESHSKPAEPPIADEPSYKKQGFLTRFKQGLSKTKHQLGDRIGRLLLGKKEIDPELLDDLEALLISADIGFATTKNIIDQLSDGLNRKALTDGEAVYAALKTHLSNLLMRNQHPLTLEATNDSPFVILMIGVNGAGKTTTIAKLAKRYQEQGKKVMLAAGDTFRAAAVEQLQTWGERHNIPVIAQHTGADSASVVFDALQAAKARGVDVVIADTAGRLHTQHHLMEELKKVKRVMKKLDPLAPHETMLVLDASIGQNALNQAKQFHKEMDITGITMTKLDGTAKGGILFAIASELDIPFRYIGIGEKVEDLRLFEPTQFVDTIFNDDRI